MFSSNTKKVDLAPPQTKVFTTAELAKYNGSDPKAPVYIGVKGTVFDVTPNKGMYAKGNPYSIFAGKDASMVIFDFPAISNEQEFRECVICVGTWNEFPKS
jgi:predicted heme/steroid binding protein